MRVPYFYLHFEILLLQDKKVLKAKLLKDISNTELLYKMENF